MSNEDRRLTWEETQAWSELVAAAYERTGRNPTSDESDAMIATAKQMVADKAKTVN